MSFVTNLVECYRRQAEAYQRVLDLARAGSELVRQGEPLSELHKVNLQKRRWLGHVEELDRSIAMAKEQWRGAEGVAGEAGELEGQLARLRDLIEAILECERETDRWITDGAAEAHQSAPAS